MIYFNLSVVEIRYLKESFVDNECHTDEYGETQPTKGLTYLYSSGLIADDVSEAVNGYVDEPNETLVSLLHNHSDVFTKQVGDWLEKAQLGRYSGSDEFIPIAEKIFDWYYDNDEHPYYGPNDDGLVREIVDELWYNMKYNLVVEVIHVIQNELELGGRYNLDHTKEWTYSEILLLPSSLLERMMWDRTQSPSFEEKYGKNLLTETIQEALDKDKRSIKEIIKLQQEYYG